MNKIKPYRRKRDRHRPDFKYFDSKICKKALRIISKVGLNSKNIQKRLKLPTELDAEKIIFHLQSHFPRKLQQKLEEFRNQQVFEEEIEKWVFNEKKPIQSLEYYLSL